MQVLKLKRQIDYWKEQAGLPAHKRDYVDLVDIQDAKQACRQGACWAALGWRIGLDGRTISAAVGCCPAVAASA